MADLERERRIEELRLRYDLASAAADWKGNRPPCREPAGGQTCLHRVWPHGDEYRSDMRNKGFFDIDKKGLCKVCRAEYHARCSAALLFELRTEALLEPPRG